eukprot:GAHX01002144.1.p1 GENE.GAHX01002144.1~~GAHX01002144.1.p1  ORF type:complete len:265 (-),score=59.40 GAHX01002144.1:152-910(-)
MKISFILSDAHLAFYKPHDDSPLVDILDINTHHALLNELDPERINNYRLDIIHRSLLTVLDSILNQHKMIHNIYLETHKGSVIRINPLLSPPRSVNRFTDFLRLLFKFGYGKRLKHKEDFKKFKKILKRTKTVCDEPKDDKKTYDELEEETRVAEILTCSMNDIVKEGKVVGLAKIATDGFVGSIEKFKEYYNKLEKQNKDKEVFFVVGLTPHDVVEKEWIKNSVSLSDKGLKASYCLSKLCIFLEEILNVY